MSSSNVGATGSGGDGGNRAATAKVNVKSQGKERAIDHDELRLPTTTATISSVNRSRDHLHTGSSRISPAASVSSASSESLAPIKPSRARLGALGIPLSDDEDFADAEVDAEGASHSLPSTHSGLEAVPVESAPRNQHLQPGVPTRPHNPLTTRSRDPERLSVKRAGSALSEESFRDIVDDLTIENRKLKGRLKRFEASSVPPNLERDRLFEVRFFDGFPTSRRQEIESFLTRYVQQLQSEDEGRPIGAGADTESAKPARLPGLRPAPARGRSHGTATATDTTSSIGVTLRSLRSSEKDELSKRAGQNWHEATSGSGSGDGSGSGQRTTSDSPLEHVDQTAPKPLAASIAFEDPDCIEIDPPPTDATPETSPRHTANVLQGEQDLLAAPSFSGVEPQSASGTGTGMRMTDPHHLRSRRKSRPEPPKLHVTVPSISRRGSQQAVASTPVVKDEAEESPPPHHNVVTSPCEDSGDSSPDMEMTTSLTTAEPLAKIVVELVERLFEEALLRSPTADSEPNSLQSEPSPLPPTSSSNTRYLRTMLESDETKRGGGWVYLNLLLTMAGVHRLNLSIEFLRWSLKRRSQHIEVSEDGSKVRWRGEARKRNDVESAAARVEGVDANDATMDNDTVEAVQQRRRANDRAAAMPLPPAPHSATVVVRPVVRAPQTTMTASDPLQRVREVENDGQSKSIPTTLSSTKNTNSTKNSNSNSTGATSVPTLDSGSRGSKNDSSSARDESGRSTRSGVSRASVSGTATHSLSNSQPSDTLRRALKKELLDARGVPEYSLRDEMVFAAPLGERLAGVEIGPTDGKPGDSPRHRPSAAYVPMFVKRRFQDEDDEDDYLARLNDDGDDSEERNGEAMDDSESPDGGAISTIATSRRARKRRRRGGQSDGGLVFFRSDVFCSDLAGNAHVRARMDRASSAETDAVDRVRVSRSDGEEDDGVPSPNASLFLSVPSSPSEEATVLDEAVSSRDTSPGDSLSWPSSPEPSSPPDTIHDDIETQHSRFPVLSLSGMTNAVPSDHFTIWTKALYPHFTPHASPAQLHKRAIITSLSALLPASHFALSDPLPCVKVLHTHTVTHLPATQVRFPRLRMRREGSDSDDESSDEEVFLRRSLVEPQGDYLLSLGLPFHDWAPETRREGGSECQTSPSTDLDNEPISLD